jgi:hypothetical protein
MGHRTNVFALDQKSRPANAAPNATAQGHVKQRALRPILWSRCRLPIVVCVFNPRFALITCGMVLCEDEGSFRSSKTKAAKAAFFIGVGLAAAQCPLWVKSRHRALKSPCPLMTQSGHRRMRSGCPLTAVSSAYSISSSARDDLRKQLRIRRVCPTSYCPLLAVPRNANACI